jgi:hypothetical protein
MSRIKQEVQTLTMGNNKGIEEKTTRNIWMRISEGCVGTGKLGRERNKSSLGLRNSSRCNWKEMCTEILVSTGLARKGIV